MFLACTAYRYCLQCLSRDPCLVHQCARGTGQAFWRVQVAVCDLLATHCSYSIKLAIYNTELNKLEANAEVRVTYARTI